MLLGTLVEFEPQPLFTSITFHPQSSPHHSATPHTDTVVLYVLCVRPRADGRRNLHSRWSIVCEYVYINVARGWRVKATSGRYEMENEIIDFAEYMARMGQLSRIHRNRSAILRAFMYYITVFVSGTRG